MFSVVNYNTVALLTLDLEDVSDGSKIRLALYDATLVKKWYHFVDENHVYFFIGHSNWLKKNNYTTPCKNEFIIFFELSDLILAIFPKDEKQKSRHEDNMKEAVC